MASSFLRRPNCFYCLSPSPRPVDPRSFRCTHCGCWNRYDARGEISSDEPAMHDDKLNARSFAKRASPSKDRLPSAHSSAPFCHACQTNQMLLVNLLSNYLPHPQHPDYALRLEHLPAYRDSLHVRYPPVCPDCLPAVQDAIEQKNQMARTSALAGWLKQSKGKERHQLTSASAVRRQAFHRAIWRTSGALWYLTLFSVLVAYVTAIQGYRFPRLFTMSVPALPILCLLSLFYTTWDPTTYRLRRAKAQGRHVRIKRKPLYVVLQALSWSSRFTTSILLLVSQYSSSWDYLHVAAYPSSYRIRTYCSVSLAIELLVFSSSFTILHLQRPPTIRLVETSSKSPRETPDSHSARASPMPTVLENEPDLLASLTLSSKPLISTAKPVFGHPSLASAQSVSQASLVENDEDAMDWTPTIPSPVKFKKSVDEDGDWVRPQRFFPPERPTGLESLFANTKLDDGDAHAAKLATPPSKDTLWSPKLTRWWLVAIVVLLVPLSSVVYHRWIRGSIQ